MDLRRESIWWGVKSRRLMFGVSRQEVAFSEERRKIKGFGSLREDFYTKFKPEN